MRRFVELAGGRGKARDRGRADGERGGGRVGRRHGGRARHPRRPGVRVPGTAARPTRRTACDRLDSATGIWFCGGDQARLTAVLGGTASLRAIQARYQGGRGRRRHLGRRRDHVGLDDHRRPDAAGRHHRLLRRRIPRHRASPRPGPARPRLPARRHRRPALHQARAPQPAHERRARASRRCSASASTRARRIEVSPDGRWRVLGESDVVVYDARSPHHRRRARRCWAPPTSGSTCCPRAASTIPRTAAPPCRRGSTDSLKPWGEGNASNSNRPVRCGGRPVRPLPDEPRARGPDRRPSAAR